MLGLCISVREIISSNHKVKKFFLPRGNIKKRCLKKRLIIAIKEGICLRIVLEDLCNINGTYAKTHDHEANSPRRAVNDHEQEYKCERS